MKYILSIGKTLLLLILSADLLYLYYSGSWHDPNPIIELAEVAILWTIAICSASATLITFVRGVKQDGENRNPNNIFKR